MPMPPEYIYPGQAFDEMGSVASLMPTMPAFAFDLASLPGGRDVVNGVTRMIMQNNIDPYGE